MLPFSNLIVSVPRAKYLPRHSRGIPIPRQPETIGGHLRKRRLELGFFQSEAAHKLGVSTVTLSRWECDKVHPTWAQQPSVTAFLGYDPFTNSILGGPKSNKPQGVAILTPGPSGNISNAILQHCLNFRKTRKQFATEIGICPKTIRNWEVGRRRPSKALSRKIEAFLR